MLNYYLFLISYIYQLTYIGYILLQSHMVRALGEIKQCASTPITQCECNGNIDHVF